MKNLNVLIIGDHSQVITKTFRAHMHNAFSCGPDKVKGQLSDYHIQNGFFDFASQSTPYQLTTQTGKIVNVESNWDLIICLPGYPTFSIMNSPCPYVAIIESTDNIPGAGTPDQTVHANQFGHPYDKKFSVWTKGLPNLKPTREIKHVNEIRHGQKVPNGILDAMYFQWTEYINDMNIVDHV